MSTWSDGWREALLTQAEIPVTQFALDVLSYWEKSTPTSTWTNNPLGMPSRGTDAPKALNTAYAAFPTMAAFRKAFTKAVHAGSGKPLYTALAAQDKLTVAWRAIHALSWPANSTETDYPSAILDAMDAASRAKLKVSDASDRKTVGLSQSQTDAHAMIRDQNQALHHAVSNISNASDAIGYVLRRMNGNG